MTKPKIIAVSGGFDPIHIGHIRLLKEAKALGDRLIVILNNDNWLKKKKGYIFMPEEERAAILPTSPENIKNVVPGNEDWWGTNFNTMEERWKAWILK